MTRGVDYIATETLLGLYGGERQPADLAEIILRAVREADRHRLSESAPQDHGYYVKCACGRYYVRYLLADAAAEQRTHQQEETFATFPSAEETPEVRAAVDRQMADPRLGNGPWHHRGCGPLGCGRDGCVPARSNSGREW